jgi:hypothetical protein
MLLKIKDCASSQMTECFFSVTAKMAPKDSHFSTSGSLENRLCQMLSVELILDLDMLKKFLNR